MLAWLSQVTWEKGALLHTAARVCALFWLFLQWDKALAHIKGPQCCQGTHSCIILLELGAVLAIVTKLGESFLKNPVRRNTELPKNERRSTK